MVIAFIIVSIITMALLVRGIRKDVGKSKTPEERRKKLRVYVGMAAFVVVLGIVLNLAAPGLVLKAAGIKITRTPIAPVTGQVIAPSLPVPQSR